MNSVDAIPMPIFLAMLHSARARTVRQNLQNSVVNDGRTGFIVIY